VMCGGVGLRSDWHFGVKRVRAMYSVLLEYNLNMRGSRKNDLVLVTNINEFNW
jgi:hypothetical protein